MSAASTWLRQTARGDSVRKNWDRWGAGSCWGPLLRRVFPAPLTIVSVSPAGIVYLFRRGIHSRLWCPHVFDLFDTSFFYRQWIFGAFYSEEYTSGREPITRDFTVGGGSRGLELAFRGWGEGSCCPFQSEGCEMWDCGGTEIQGGHPCITRLPGGARFQFERWRDLEEVEDLGVLWIELSPQILVLKSRPALFLRLWP